MGQHPTEKLIMTCTRSNNVILQHQLDTYLSHITWKKKLSLDCASATAVTLSSPAAPHVLSVCQNHTISQDLSSVIP
jgi:hypothetical protein